MKKTILILTSDPKSINSEIINKSIFFFNKNNKNNYIFIGDKEKIISPKNFRKLNFINIKNKNSDKKYLHSCFNEAFRLLKNKKADGLINLPLNKSYLAHKYPGFTEYLSDSFNLLGKESMLLFNENFSVCTNTTHIPLSRVSKKITKHIIVKNIHNIHNFYKKIVGIKNPRIGVIGLNPHNGMDFRYRTEEKSIIIPILTKLRNKFNIIGPLSPDTAFNIIKKEKLNCLLGNYHDQVLPTFKYINKFNAINITLGLPFIRISPDHGVATNLIGKNQANPKSFLYALNFFEKFSKKI